MAYLIQQPVQEETPWSVPLDPPRKAQELTIKWMEWYQQGDLSSQSIIFEIACDSQNYPAFLPCTNANCRRGGFPVGPHIAKMLRKGDACYTDSLICCQMDTFELGCNHSINFVVEVA